MIYAVRSKVSKAPADNYSVAVCDLCKAQCEESKQPGQTGPNGRDAASAAARAVGWTDRTVRDDNPRRRGPTWTVQLLCPKCQAAEVPTVKVIDDDGEAD